MGGQRVQSPLPQVYHKAEVWPAKSGFFPFFHRSYLRLYRIGLAASNSLGQERLVLMQMSLVQSNSRSAGGRQDIEEKKSIPETEGENESNEIKSALAKTRRTGSRNHCGVAPDLACGT